VDDLLENDMELEHHIVIPKPQDEPLMVAQVLITNRVVRRAVLMSGAIEFDRNPQG